jgi:hypothetical protein
VATFYEAMSFDLLKFINEYLNTAKLISLGEEKIF